MIFTSSETQVALMFCCRRKKLIAGNKTFFRSSKGEEVYSNPGFNQTGFG